MAQIEVSNKEGSKEAAFVQKLLDSYFMFRDCLPKDGFIQENKTTQQIQDELEPMYSVTMPRLFRRTWTQAEDWFGASRTAKPVPETKPVPAKPMPSPSFILPFLSYQPISFAAVSRVSL